MLKVMKFDRNQTKKDAPPSPAIGYLSQTAGSFTLDGNTGHASFVWYHEPDLKVDWHSHTMTYVGTYPAGGIEFWQYKIDGHKGDEELSFLFAKERTNSDQASDSDEGFRIFL